MGEQMARLLADALRLSAEERLRLAEELYESVAVAVADRDINTVWTEEIRRRLDDIHQGRVEGIPSEEVFAQIRARLSSHPG